MTLEAVKTFSEYIAEKSPPTFDQEFLDRITRAADQLEDIAAERNALNAKKNAVITNLETYGLDTKAVMDVFKFMQLDEGVRKNYDLSYAIARKAMGAPLQDDLFAAAAKNAVSRHSNR